MALVVVGLGNPGKEYAGTRHNTGRSAVEELARAGDFDEFVCNKKANAAVAKGSLGGKNMILVLPETMMNVSGKAVAAFVKSPRAAKDLMVIQDDLDLPLGVIKMVAGRGSGGHKGVESIMRAIKSKDFTRIRVGISPQGKKHQPKKPTGEEKVIRFVLGRFKPAEALVLKKTFKKVQEAVRIFAEEGAPAATQFANTR